MLQSLHVRDLAVVRAVDVEFGPGLNVLTGETGAGKSILVDSLALLAGVRANAELIRAGHASLNGSSVRPSHVVRAGDRITLTGRGVATDVISGSIFALSSQPFHNQGRLTDWSMYAANTRKKIGRAHV